MTAMPRRERGYVLVSFAMLLVPLLALAALLMDAGAAAFFQARLAAVADSAVLEGSRGWRGAEDPGWCNAAPGCDPAERQALWDAERRARANAGVAAAFAPGDAAAPRLGPIRTALLELDEGLADPSLSALLVDAADPRLEGATPLEANPSDLAEGDMVAGRFNGPGIIPVRSCGNPDIMEAFGENCAYERRQVSDGISDFTAGADLPPGSAHRAFLLRLRLTGETAIAGVAAPDERLPVLFGRLADRALRQNGIAVRGTAIADARPALAAGRADPETGRIGAAPAAFDVDWWRSLASDDAPRTLAVAGGLVLDESAVVVGRLVDGAPRAVFVGEPAEPGSTLAGADGEAYVPLLRTTADGVVRVVAFGRALVQAAPGASELVIRKRPGAVAHDNASAVTTAGLGGLPEALVAELFTEYSLASCDAADPLAALCAAVLVR